MNRKLLIGFLGLCLCGGMKAADTLSFLPHWRAQAQFIGYYVAQEKGFYEDKGLCVKFLSSRIAKRVNEELQTLEVDVFTMPLLPAVSIHFERRPLHCLAQYSQANGQLVFVRKSSGIERLSDLNGKSIGILQHEMGFLPYLFLKSKKIEVEIVPLSQSVNLFMRGGLDAMIGSYANEYGLLRMYGLDEDSIHRFFLAGYGWDIPEDGLYCRAADYQRRPSMYRRFADASTTGWEYAFAHPDEALKILEKWMKDDNVPFQYAHQKWMLQTLRQLFYYQKGKLDTRLRESDFLEACRVLEIPDERARRAYKNFCPKP